MFVKPGESIVLKCNTTADNSTDFWLYLTKKNSPHETLTEGVDVNNHYKTRIQITGNTRNGEYHLKILNFTRQDEGIYRCITDREIMPVDVYLQMKGVFLRSLVFDIINIIKCM
ncbi:Hypothetical predicted protein [Mytilus galloprovincialis]|uniref:Ig-like domain-containing protein n=1 Tax=Mytilus galloprovincialis TaxID=29158 RepID=A0A8B6E522_MYTGA|nr:Hypothetical predicted protein [Mytilus galloprovincialis]